ncbi:hypothetical protein F441_23037 [Phytophthora nicotianae CJ01A1]|uniref:Uncharacterized protein n=1 Tax=Phytophthora nicotianae CJ01A1 TaxID=1317063 RepID=W2VQ51_PHYNI|nr:hypothetical protein F441_23037 [Phytophthora nicotianae CJ01A1]
MSPPHPVIKNYLRDATVQQRCATDSLRQVRIKFGIKMRRGHFGLVIKIDVQRRVSDKIDVQRQVMTKINGCVLSKIDEKAQALDKIVGWRQRHFGLVI